MGARIIMLLGRAAWIRGASGWRSQMFGDDGDLVGPAVAYLGRYIAEESAARTTVVFEPETIAHQTVETPRASRAVFASLERVRSEHAVVLSDRLGWGIEIPEPLQSGAYSTLMHAELAPGLGYLRDACLRDGGKLVAAWSAYTVAAACLKVSLPHSKARIVLILVDGFVGVAMCSGPRRSFKSWAGPMTDRDWRAFSLLIGEFDGTSTLSKAEVALRRGGILAVAEGDPKLVCPLWPEIRGSGRVEAVVGLDALAAGADVLPASHPANLAEAFPVPIQLDRALAGTAALLVACAVASGFSAIRLHRQIGADRTAHHKQAGVLEDQLATLERNKKEMSALGREAPVEDDSPAAGRADALLGLAGAVPDAVTLTSLVLGKDNAFEIEAIVVGTGMDLDSFRSALEKAGFKPAMPGGWLFDTPSGRIKVRGKYEERRA
jgi:hypothetical protein